MSIIRELRHTAHDHVALPFVPNFLSRRNISLPRGITLMKGNQGASNYQMIWKTNGIVNLTVKFLLDTAYHVGWVTDTSIIHDSRHTAHGRAFAWYRVYCSNLPSIVVFLSYFCPTFAVNVTCGPLQLYNCILFVLTYWHSLQATVMFHLTIRNLWLFCADDTLSSSLIFLNQLVTSLMNVVLVSWALRISAGFLRCACFHTQ